MSREHVTLYLADALDRLGLVVVPGREPVVVEMVVAVVGDDDRPNLADDTRTITRTLMLLRPDLIQPSRPHVDS